VDVRTSLVTAVEEAVAKKLAELSNAYYETSLDDLEWEVVDGDYEQQRQGGDPQFTPEMHVAAERIRAAVQPLIETWRQAAADEDSAHAAYFEAKRRREQAEQPMMAQIRSLIAEERVKHPIEQRRQAVKQLLADVKQQLNDGVAVDITKAIEHIVAM
jgi:hypothetical protein